MNQKLRFSLLAIAFFGIALSAWKMYQLPLWSWWILLLLTSAWSFWLLAAHRLYTKPEKGWRWLGLSTLSGFLLSAGFPVSPLTPLMFIAFVPLLILIDEILASDESIKKRLLMRYGYNTFVWWNVLVTFWVGNAGFIPGLIANFLNSFFMSLPILAYFICKERFFIHKNQYFLSFLCFTSFWFSWEHLHLSWDLSWPWLTLGNAFAEKTDWIQWYEFTGVFGGGLWILVVNFLVYACFNLEKSAFDFFNKKQLTFVALTLFVPIGFSFLIKNSRKNEISDRKSVEIVALQPNYEPHYEKFEVPDADQLRRFLTLSNQNITKNTDYLIFPETSFGLFDADHLESYEPIQAFQALADSFPKLHIVSGFDMFRLYPSGDNLPPTVRQRGNRNIEIYNAATQIVHNQQNMPIYKKSKLVPGAEILPFYKYLSFLKPLFKRFGGTVEGLGGQSERNLLWNADGIGIAPVICYESIYGDYCADYVRHGAKAMFVMTNDGWWDDTPGYRQHLDFARLRAVEFRLPVVRSANTGSSAVINRLGEVEMATEYGIATAVKSKIILGKDMTFYARYGDILPKIALIISLLFVVFVFLQKKPTFVSK